MITKPGTVTHVLCPGASSMRGITGYRVSDVMNGALAQLIPERVPAAGEGGSTLAFFTGRVAGEPFVYSELVVGTWGGRPHADGNDGLANPCASMANIPVELAESDWPILIERYGLVADSGGAGRFRGGLAVERVWRALAPDTAVHVRSDRQVHRPYGLAGGGDGGGSSTLLLRADGTVERMPPDVRRLLQPGDVLHHRMAGGGGFGDPFERDPEAVARDVRDEKVSPRRPGRCTGSSSTAVRSTAARPQSPAAEAWAVKITKVEATPLAIPLLQEFHWAGGAQRGANLVLFSVHTDEGVTGYGESVSEDQRAVVAYGELIGRQLIGRSPGDIEAILHSIFTEGRWKMFPQFTQLTFAGIEVACWDALGRALGVPSPTSSAGGCRSSSTTSASSRATTPRRSPRTRTSSREGASR